MSKRNWKEYGRERRKKPEFREQHKKACLNWNRNHKERDNGNSNRRPEQWRAQLQAERIIITKFCELCPEDDQQEATQRHHPNYNYPTIFVSCCASCHNYVEKGDD